MEIKYQDIITLSDKNKYVVASKISYNNSNKLINKNPPTFTSRRANK